MINCLRLGFIIFAIIDIFSGNSYISSVIDSFFNCLFLRLGFNLSFVWGSRFGPEILYSSVPLCLDHVFFSSWWSWSILRLRTNRDVSISSKGIKHTLTVRTLHCGCLSTSCLFHNFWIESLSIGNFFEFM